MEVEFRFCCLPDREIGEDGKIVWMRWQMFGEWNPGLWGGNKRVGSSHIRIGGGKTGGL